MVSRSHIAKSFDVLHGGTTPIDAEQTDLRGPQGRSLPLVRRCVLRECGIILHRATLARASALRMTRDRDRTKGSRFRYAREKRHERLRVTLADSQTLAGSIAVASVGNVQRWTPFATASGRARAQPHFRCLPVSQGRSLR
jgi:hypothetical protein